MAVASLPRLFAAPGLVEPKFGLLSAIQWQDGSDPHSQLGVQWQPYRCDAADLTNGLFCGDVTGEPYGVPKTTERGVPLVVASPFAVYGSFSCNPIGMPIDEAFDRARMHLQTGRGRAIERAIQLGEAGNEPSFDSAVDVTPGGTAVSLIEAVALLEQYLGENYGGTGVIHFDRRLATQALSDRLVHAEGDRLYTGLGTSAVAGAGYDLTVGPAGAAGLWLYATGSVHGWQSDVGTFPDSPGGAIDRARNNMVVLAEQTFSIGWDCLTAAVEVDPLTLRIDSGA